MNENMFSVCLCEFERFPNIVSVALDAGRIFSGWRIPFFLASSMTCIRVFLYLEDILFAIFHRIKPLY